MALCWPLQLPQTAKAVLISLADQANDHGVCWPSVGTIAERCCITPRSVQAAMRWLQEAGIVQTQVHHRPNGCSTSNVYTIDVDGFLAKSGPKNEVGEGERGSPSRVNVVQGEGERGAPLEPSLEPNSIPPNPPLPLATGGNTEPIGPKRKRRTADAMTLAQWLERCKAEGKVPIPPDDPVYAYCDRAGIAREILLLHWAEFKTRRSEGRKRQADWRATFRNSVRANWFRLWFIAPGQAAQLTTVGRQAEANHAALVPA
jgi:hypothetical protein